MLSELFPVIFFIARLFTKITDEKHEQLPVKERVGSETGYKVVCGDGSCIFEFEAYRYDNTIDSDDDSSVAFDSFQPVRTTGGEGERDGHAGGKGTRDRHASDEDARDRHGGGVHARDEHTSSEGARDGGMGRRDRHSGGEGHVRQSNNEEIVVVDMETCSHDARSNASNDTFHSADSEHGPNNATVPDDRTGDNSLIQPVAPTLSSASLPPNTGGRLNGTRVDKNASSSLRQRSGGIPAPDNSRSETTTEL